MKIEKSFFSSVRLSHLLPLYISGVNAGFPSPAEDYTDLSLDLNEHLIQHPSATFYVYARGDSMIDSGIYDGDLLIVDRALDPVNNSIVIAVVNGDFTVKKIIKKNKKLYLMPNNIKYTPIEVTSDTNFEIWGVVTYTIHAPK